MGEKSKSYREQETDPRFMSGSEQRRNKFVVNLMGGGRDIIHFFLLSFSVVLEYVSLSSEVVLCSSSLPVFISLSLFHLFLVLRNGRFWGELGKN